MNNREDRAAEQAKDPVKTLRAALTENLHIDLAKHPIDCSLEDGAIVVEGLVESIAQKKRAMYIAMGLKGTTGVVDRLRVRPSTAMTDEEVRQHILDALTEEPSLDAASVNIEVSAGVVDLEGTVGSLTHKRLAGVLAWWVPGSTDVINSLELDPPEEDSDGEIADAVRIVLEKDHLVNPSSIGVRVDGWTVTLSGVAASEAARNAAEEDAWFVWGVNDVKNDIIVR